MLSTLSTTPTHPKYQNDNTNNNQMKMFKFTEVFSTVPQSTKKISACSNKLLWTLHFFVKFFTITLKEKGECKTKCKLNMLIFR